MSESDEELEATKAGATWQTGESDEPEQDDTVTEKDARRGRVEDPNLGDVPVDEQPHPGSGEPA